MEGFWPVFYLMVILKIPVAFLLYLVYWAVKQTNEPETAPEAGEDHGFRRWRTEPKRPRGPRRGPHAPDARGLPAPVKQLLQRLRNDDGPHGALRKT